MVLIAQAMKQHDNDNEKFSFITLQAATRNVTRYLGLDEQKDSGHEDGAGKNRNQIALKQRELVRIGK
jgi:hypothetical protein